MTQSRRRFIRFVPALGAFAVPAFGQQPAAPNPQAAIRSPQSAAGPDWPPPEPARGTPVDESFPSQHLALAKEIVGVSHGNLARVRELVQQHPALAKASFDWGYGDWETALGAASHTGRREIAELLIENGAPPTLFSAAMLGQLDLVKAFVAAKPGAQRMRGPHSISLMVHAKLGGPPAASVVSYLESLGDADLALKGRTHHHRGSRAAGWPLRLRRSRAGQLHRHHDAERGGHPPSRRHGPAIAGTWATWSSIRWERRPCGSASSARGRRSWR
jgi:hypothetical protein